MTMRGFARSVAMAAAATLLLTSAGLAQRREIPLDARNPVFQEHLDQDAKVNDGGQLLIGLKWLGPAGAFDLSQVAIRSTPALRGLKACVRIASRDGRYHAQNLYAIPSDLVEIPRFAAVVSKFPLSSLYANDVIAVAVQLVDDCKTGVRGVFLPALLGGTAGPQGSPMPPGISLPRRLLAQLHGEPNQLSVRLLDHDREIGAAASCQTDTSTRRIAYTSTCMVAVSEAVVPGRYLLEVSFRQRFDISKVAYPIDIN